MSQTGKAPISAIMIVLNERKNLERSLPSLSFCNEVVVVDSGSTDGSIEFARKSGCTVIHRDFDHFGAQKSYAASLACNDWVFNLDADEWVTPELATEISELVKNQELNSIWIRSRLVFLNRIFRFGRESRVRVLRIFRRSAGDFDRASVHEKVVVQDPRETTTFNHILHYSYPDLPHYFQKMERYTSLGAETLKSRTSMPEAVLRAALFPAKFVQFYLLQLNFLNGREGLLWSILSSYAYFLKFLKTARRA
ncbi:MAG: glycosyltransferase family 2 protein [Bdellovibrionales bacterium]|nr:glycosyltransferase family 2 protein [Bdellovibrionales bacterium]